MARPLTRVIKELRTKIETLAAQRDAARAAHEWLSREVADLKRQLDECRDELKDARMEVDFLTVSYRLADSPSHLIAARRRVQRLIAKIGRCVSLLKDDADIS